MKGRKTSVYIKEDLQKALHIEPYGWRGASGAVNMVAERYTTLIKSGEKKVSGIFTEKEFKAIFNVCCGKKWIPAAVIRIGVLAMVQDAEENELLGVNKEELVEKLTGLSPLESFALVELIEQKEGEKNDESRN